jgi:alpha-ketoglutarate-dependent taurine dioxygenase
VWDARTLREDEWLVRRHAYGVRPAAELRRRLWEGPGFAVVRGVELDGLSDEECVQVCRDMTGLVGTVRPRGPGRATDELVTAAAQTRTLADGTRDAGDGALFLHSDRSSQQRPPRVLGLLCVRPALHGGDSLLASGPAVYNRLLERAPDLLPLLHEDFHFGRGDGFDRVFPVFRRTAGTVAVLYNRYQIEHAHRKAGRPLSARHLAALDAFDEVLADPHMTVRVALRRGDLLLVANTTVLHGRTAFTDPGGPDAPGGPGGPSRARCLVRVWAD